MEYKLIHWYGTTDMTSTDELHLSRGMGTEIFHNLDELRDWIEKNIQVLAKQLATVRKAKIEVDNIKDAYGVALSDPSKSLHPDLRLDITNPGLIDPVTRELARYKSRIFVFIVPTGITVHEYGEEGHTFTIQLEEETTNE